MDMNKATLMPQQRWKRLIRAFPMAYQLVLEQLAMAFNHEFK